MSGVTSLEQGGNLGVATSGGNMRRATTIALYMGIGSVFEKQRVFYNGRFQQHGLFKILRMLQYTVQASIDSG